MNLRLVTPETQFQMVSNGISRWSISGLGRTAFPQSGDATGNLRWRTSNNTNNITGFKNARVDEIVRARTTRCSTSKDRIKAIREIDGILANAYQYVLAVVRALSSGWSYWNKFGTPPGLSYCAPATPTRLHQMWWIDPPRMRKLQKALRDPSVKLDVGPTEDHYWDEYAKDASVRTQ